MWNDDRPCYFTIYKIITRTPSPLTPLSSVLSLIGAFVSPPHLGNEFTAHNYYSPLSRMSRTPVFIINPHLLTPSDTGK